MRKEALMNWLSFFIGVLVGWLIELLIDFFFWRRRRQESDSTMEVRTELATMETKAGHLEAQLVGVQDDQARCARELQACHEALSQARAQLAAKEDEVQQLQASLADAHISMAERTSALTTLAGFDPHNLQKIEGIGPKIAGILNAHGIHNFADLAKAAVEDLQQYLREAGPRYRLADPTTWPAQARLAADGDWEALDTLQGNLKGGRVQPQ
jgi:predicted flap endonuclease-1-like 5' DNA nuclease